MRCRMPSYGVFLNHFLVMWLVDHVQISRLCLPVLSLWAAILSYRIVQVPALVARQKARKVSDRAAARI